MITNLYDLAKLFSNAEIKICEIAGILCLSGPEGRVFQEGNSFSFIRYASPTVSSFNPNEIRHLRTAIRACGLLFKKRERKQ